MEYLKKVTKSQSGSDQEQENETQADVASPSSSVELTEGAHPCPTCPASVHPNSRSQNQQRDRNSPRSTDCSGEEDYSCGNCNKMHTDERPGHRAVTPNSCTDSEGGSSGSERPPTTSQDEYNNNEIASRSTPDLIDQQQPSPSNRANKRKCPDGDSNDMDSQRKDGKILLNNSRMVIRLRHEEAFTCPVCHRQDFATSALLETHLECAHPEFPTKCETCHLTFKNHRVLNLHRTMKHFNENSTGNNSRSPRNFVDGFNDCTFTDFSSTKFPTIARAMCEREPHRPASGEANRFQCMKCLLAFPCRQAHLAHEEECKGPCENKRGNNDSNNNNNSSTNNNLEADMDIANTQSEDLRTKRETFFAVLDLQNKSSARDGIRERKEMKNLNDMKEPRETKDLADIQSILTVARNASMLQSFPRSDASTPENNIKFNPSAGSSGSSGTCSSEYNEEETQDVFTAEFRRMKMKGEFPCKLCPTVLRNLRALKGHNRVHIKEASDHGLPYPCNMCPYTSTDKTALQRHLRSHNGDRPFECSLCNYAFTTKANCERHVKKTHNKYNKEEIQSALIYHPSEDSTNDNVGRSSPRVVKEDVRKALVYPNEHEEASQQQLQPPLYPIDCRNPGPSMYQTICGDKLLEPLNLIKRDTPEPRDALVNSNYSKTDEESRSSDGSVSLVSDMKTDQRIQASPMNLSKPSTSAASFEPNEGEEGPLDLSMDVLDLSKKRGTAKKENEASCLQTSTSQEENTQHNNNQSEIYVTSQLLLTHALLKNAATGVNPPSSLETLYANQSLFYRNLISPYLLNPHMLNHELMNGKFQRQLSRGLQLTGGGTVVEPSMPSTSYATHSQTRDIAPQTSTEQSVYANTASAQITSQQVAPSCRQLTRRTEGIPLNNSVKMVIKDGKLVPKQKQRRYRTERPFTCQYCFARFTLRSNMDRHVKQQHPSRWNQKKPRGGHSARGRPPANHSVALQRLEMSEDVRPSTSQAALANSSMPQTQLSTSTEHSRHPISDQVKYAILAQQLKANKIDDNDSEDEMVIDEESGDRDAQESQQVQQEPGTSLLRDQLENNIEDAKDVVVKMEVDEPAEGINSAESHSEQQAVQDNTSQIKQEDTVPVESKELRSEATINSQTTGNEQVKLEDGTADLASVSKLLDNASQQYQQFQPQYLSDEEGLIASTSDYNNSGSEKSDSLNSLNSNNSSNNKRRKKKKKSAYSMAPNRVICPYCQRPFPWTSSLRRHILTHTGQKPYQCIHCSHHFTTKSNCDRHLLRKHKTKASKTRRVRNSSSPEVEPVVSNNSTFTTRNVPERPYKCNQCPSSTFSTLGNLKKHRSTKHARKTKPRSDTPSSDQQNSPSQSTQNDQSDYESRSSSVSENTDNSPPVPGTSRSNPNTSPSVNHENTRSRKSSPTPVDFPFKCHLCDSSFAERQDCLEHIKDNHKRSYEMLVAKGALDMDIDASEDQTQMQQHSSDGEGRGGRSHDYSNRKVVCAFCMRRFWSAEDLRRHMRTHTGERPFQCDICCRKFTLKHSMLRHRKKHESVDSAMYIGNSGDEDNSPSQPPTITPRSQQHSPIPTNTSRPRAQDRISLPTVAAVATADAAPCALMRYNHYDNMATLTGRMANDRPQNVAPAAETPGESGDNDLISDLLGIREKGLLDKVLLSTADDAAKLLGVNHNE